MGVLTKYLLEKDQNIYLAEIDTESIEYLKNNYKKVTEETFVGDFRNRISVLSKTIRLLSLEISLITFPVTDSFSDCRSLPIDPEMVGMFQKRGC